MRKGSSLTRLYRGIPIKVLCLNKLNKMKLNKSKLRLAIQKKRSMILERKRKEEDQTLLIKAEVFHQDLITRLRGILYLH